MLSCPAIYKLLNWNCDAYICLPNMYITAVDSKIYVMIGTQKYVQS